MIEAILAYAMMFHLEDSRPQLMVPFTSLAACLIEAEKLNRTDEDLRDPRVRAVGGEYVCLVIKKVGV